ncbi:alpha/beta fold hydrolase [Roseobacter sinensis]|uniref:Alpha/beta fold hydrolase n=1 Tax=Roseobacter sinensis TaxID=2931391 RepID=A0ABT3BJD8_9RHOB|nr:alpha/beta fold hydrolase [Roseobacter sp. WL0113]MCV3273690.1 alpha/beta fold hydrolase [Roseobacter sp. WL0113]
MTPLVLVHGFIGGSAQWEEQIDALSVDREVIALDLPGFGRNAHLPVIDTIGGFADWAMAALDERGVRRFCLLGHSMGGMIVQEMARRAPGRIVQLILYATGALGILPGRFETIAESKARARAEGAGVTARRIAATWFRESEQAPRYEGCAAIAEHASLGAVLAGLDAMEAWSGEAALSQLDMPTLIIWGDGDRTYPWAQTELLWRTLPGANLAVIPGCAHAVHLEKPHLFNAVLRDHLTNAP